MKGPEVYDNPAAVLVVLEIRHPNAEPVSRVAQMRIKQALAEDLPLQRMATVATIRAVVGGSSDVVQETAPKYVSRDQATSVTFRSNAIAIETTRYIGYQWFRRLASTAFQARQDAAPVDGIERIGLRYVNEIRVPEVGSHLQDWAMWVDPSLLGPAEITEHLGIQTDLTQGVSLLATGSDRSIILRYGLRYGYAVDPTGDLRRPSVPASGPFFLLDIDSSWTPTGEIPEPDPEALPALCDELHKPARQLFEALIADRLRKEVLSDGASDTATTPVRRGARGQRNRS